METKPEISEREAEELIKGMGRVATVVVHDDGHVTAIAISAEPTLRIQNEVDGLLDDIRHKYRIVKKTKQSQAQAADAAAGTTGIGKSVKTAGDHATAACGGDAREAVKALLNYCPTDQRLR